jgi:hypothetical protein
MNLRWSLSFFFIMACAGTAYGNAITLRCQLMNSVPRSGGTTPDPPFLWRFHVDLEAGIVDGVRATISDSQIRWAGRIAPALPYATLLRPGWLLDGHKQPDWRFHSDRYIGQIHNDVDGSCVEQK